MDINRKRFRFLLNIETAIVILIAGCMIFLINFTNTKLEQFTQMEDEVTLINHDPSNPIHDQLAQEISVYRPDTYKMIEVYTSDFGLMMSLQFMDVEVSDIQIINYPELIKILLNNHEGHTDFEYKDDDGKDVKQDIYFKWVYAADGNEYLIVTYSSYHTVDNLWVFNFVAYSVIILVFVLLMQVKITTYIDKINQYETVSKSVRKAINK